MHVGELRRFGQSRVGHHDRAAPLLDSTEPPYGVRNRRRMAVRHDEVLSEVDEQLGVFPVDHGLYERRAQHQIRDELSVRRIDCHWAVKLPRTERSDPLARRIEPCRVEHDDGPVDSDRVRSVFGHNGLQAGGQVLKRFVPAGRPPIQDGPGQCVGGVVNVRQGPTL